MFWWNWVGRLNWFLLTWQAVSKRWTHASALLSDQNNQGQRDVPLLRVFAQAMHGKMIHFTPQARIVVFCGLDSGKRILMIAADTQTLYVIISVYGSYWYISIWISPMHILYRRFRPFCAHIYWMNTYECIGIRRTRTCSMSISIQTYIEAWSLGIYAHVSTCIHLSSLLQ